VQRPDGPSPETKQVAAADRPQVASPQTLQAASPQLIEDVRRMGLCVKELQSRLDEVMQHNSSLANRVRELETVHAAAAASEEALQTRIRELEYSVRRSNEWSNEWTSWRTNQ
jgi:chromosome segregation ATPase